MGGCNPFIPGSCNVPILDVVGNLIAFGTDPAGYWAQKMAGGSGALMGMMQSLTDVLEPDYSMDWWLRLYGINFAFAILCFLFTQSGLWLWVARRKISPGEAVEASFGGGWIFLIGAMWGPGIQVGVAQIVSAASAGVITTMLGYSGSDIFTALGNRMISADPAGFLGGSMVALAVFTVMFASMIGAVFILVLQLAAQYLVGGLLPLFMIWFTHPATRKFGVAGLLIILALYATHFLLFLGLGASWMLMSGIGLGWADDGGDTDGFSMLISFGVTASAAALAVFSPMGLIAMFRGAFPMIGGGGSSTKGGFNAPNSHGVPSGRGGGGGGNGSGTNDAAAESSATAPTAGGNGAAGGGGVPASSTVADTATSSSTGSGSATTSGAGTAAATEASATAGSAASAGSAAAGGAAAGGAAAGGAAAGGAVAGGSAAAGGMAAAGGAASATGVGAAVGVPLLLAAAAMKAAQVAESTADQVADAGIDN